MKDFFLNVGSTLVALLIENATKYAVGSKMSKWEAYKLDSGGKKMSVEEAVKIIRS